MGLVGESGSGAGGKEGEEGSGGTLEVEAKTSNAKVGCSFNDHFSSSSEQSELTSTPTCLRFLPAD